MKCCLLSLSNINNRLCGYCVCGILVKNTAIFSSVCAANK